MAPRRERPLDSERILGNFIANHRWDDVAVRMKTNEGREELRRRDESGFLPLHWACWHGAPFSLVDAMVKEYPEAIKVASNSGRLILHSACDCDGSVSPRVVQIILDAYPEGAKATNSAGQLPVHFAAGSNAPLDVFRMLVDANPEGVATLDIHGRLALHLSARSNAPFEVLMMLIDANPEGAATPNNNGRLPVHLLASEASPHKKEHVDKVELLISPLLKQKQACKAAGWNRMLPLHIAAQFGLSMGILQELLDTYGDAAKETCKCGEEILYALDLFERNWKEKVAAMEQVHSNESCGSTATCGIINNSSEESLVNQSGQAATEHPIEVLHDSVSEFSQKSDLLFSYNPNICPYRKEKARLQRFVDLITKEAQERNLSEPARRLWIWMCTFANADDSSDNYISQINAILNGLGDRKLVKWLASVETPGVRQIREIAAPNCAKAINAQFLFAGRLELSRDPPMHKSATCIVVDAKDYGDPFFQMRDLDRKTILNEHQRVVVKFMSNPKQFDREISSRKSKSSETSSEVSQRPMLVPTVASFDSRESNPSDDLYARDVMENEIVFGHDLSRFPYAVVMKRADKNFHSIYYQESPSTLKVRAYMEELARVLVQLHRAGRIHADVKLLNVVRLDGCLSLIDMDASCSMDEDYVGTKFSSGILPPEMIHELKHGEEQMFRSYWMGALNDFDFLQQLVTKTSIDAPNEICSLFAENLADCQDDWRELFRFYSDQSPLFRVLVQESKSLQDMQIVWNRIVGNASLWAKIRPKESSDGRRFVVKVFECGRDGNGLPYALVRASSALDIWSFGVLLYKLLTKSSLFPVEEDTDDLLTGDDFSMVSKWDPTQRDAQQKLKKIHDGLARNLVQRLLQPDPFRRPQQMADVLEDDFFCSDFYEAKKILQQNISTLKEKLERHAGAANNQIMKAKRSLQRKEKELKDLIASMRFTDLIHYRKWEGVKLRLQDSRTDFSNDLLLRVCAYDPPLDVVEFILDCDDSLLQETDHRGCLALHIACTRGASYDIVELLVRLDREALTARNKMNKTPLDAAMTTCWIYRKASQTEVIHYLQRMTFPDFFHSQEKTGLPNESAFKKWAHLPPPGVTNACAIVLYIDISGFKAVDDNLNHDAGDMVLEIYVSGIKKACDKAQHDIDSSVGMIIDVFRLGGDEFAVVGRFAENEVVTTLRDVWNDSFKSLVEEVAGLSVNDVQIPPTFLRIGCSAGSVGRMQQLLAKAEELQYEVRDNIGLKRGESASLAEVLASGKCNFSELFEVSCQGSDALDG